MVDQLSEDELRARFIRGPFLVRATARVDESLATAEKLLDGGHPSAAYVWAARSAEIFFREVLLLPAYYVETGDISSAMKKARSVLQSGQWKRALEAVRKIYGLEEDAHEMLTVDEEPFLPHWRRAFGFRGEVVHGIEEATPDEAQNCIEAVKRLRSFWMIRVTTSSTGPYADLLLEIIRSAREMMDVPDEGDAERR